MKLSSDVRLIFSDKEGNKKELTITVMDMLERSLCDFYEDLEEQCTSSGCNNESQNFCDCDAAYGDYEIIEIIEIEN